MLRRFQLKCDLIEGQDRFATLDYDTETDQYAMHIPADINPLWLPAIPRILFEKGVLEVEDKWARRFVQERVIPPSRHNIGDILRRIGVPCYSEFAILEYCSGRCAMDEFYLEEIELPVG